MQTETQDLETGQRQDKKEGQRQDERERFDCLCEDNLKYPKNYLKRHIIM